MGKVYSTLGIFVLVLLGMFLVNSEGVEYVYAGLGCFIVALVYFIIKLIKD